MHLLGCFEQCVTIRLQWFCGWLAEHIYAVARVLRVNLRMLLGYLWWFQGCCHTIAKVCVSSMLL